MIQLVECFPKELFPTADAEVVLAWLEQGGQVDARCAEKNSWTSLMAAAGGGHTSLVRLLLQRSLRTADGRRLKANSGDPETNLVCKCEKVTEAEVVAACHRAVPVESTQAVRKRTRAGMGHCQGDPSNFACEAKVRAIVAREARLRGRDVGTRLGAAEGSAVGPGVGLGEGSGVGLGVGWGAGPEVGTTLGAAVVGEGEGSLVGVSEGAGDGNRDGAGDGAAVEGSGDGAGDGTAVEGSGVGIGVGNGVGSGDGLGVAKM